MNEQAIEIISTIGPTCVLIVFLSIIVIITRQRKNTETHYPHLQANFDVVTPSQTAKSTAMAVVTKCNKRTIPYLLQTIKKAAELGETRIDYDAYKITPAEGNYLQQLFASFGYDTRYKRAQDLTIKWDKETTSMLKSRIPPLCRCKSCDRCHHEPETPCPKCETIDHRVCWL